MLSRIKMATHATPIHDPNASQKTHTIREGYLRKKKKGPKKYFVIRSDGCLVVYDSQAKFERYPDKPTRLIVLRQCFNIGQPDKNKPVIVLYNAVDKFPIVFDSEFELNEWLNDMLIFLIGKYYDIGEPRPLPSYVWKVQVHDRGLGGYHRISGWYRLGLCEDMLYLETCNEEDNNNSNRSPADGGVSGLTHGYMQGYTQGNHLFPQGYTQLIRNREKTIQIPFQAVRRLGHCDQFLFIETGRWSEIGPGELWLTSIDKSTAVNICECLISKIVKKEKAGKKGFWTQWFTLTLPDVRCFFRGSKDDTVDANGQHKQKSRTTPETTTETKAPINFKYLISLFLGHSIGDSSAAVNNNNGRNALKIAHHRTQSLPICRELNDGGPREDSSSNSSCETLRAGTNNNSTSSLNNNTNALSISILAGVRGAADADSYAALSAAARAAATPSCKKYTSYSNKRKVFNNNNSSGNRERCDSLPTRARTSSDQGSRFISYGRRPYSMISPDGPASPSNCSTDSVGSLLSNEDGMISELYMPSTPDGRGVIFEECESDAITMLDNSPNLSSGIHSESPSARSCGSTPPDGCHVTMEPRSYENIKSTNGSCTSIHSSIQSGTPSTDSRLRDYHLEKTYSYIFDDLNDKYTDDTGNTHADANTDEPRQVRTYSFGSKPAMEHMKSLSESMRVRAFSVGSHVKSFAGRNRKASSAPAPLIGAPDISNWMEMDFSKKRFTKDHYPKKTKAQDSGYVPMAPLSVQKLEEESFDCVDGAKEEAPYLDMTGNFPNSRETHPYSYHLYSSSPKYSTSPKRGLFGIRTSSASVCDKLPRDDHRVKTTSGSSACSDDSEPDKSRVNSLDYCIMTGRGPKNGPLQNGFNLDATKKSERVKSKPIAILPQMNFLSLFTHESDKNGVKNKTPPRTLPKNASPMDHARSEFTSNLGPSSISPSAFPYGLYSYDEDKVPVDATSGRVRLITEPEASKSLRHNSIDELMRIKAALTRRNMRVSESFDTPDSLSLHTAHTMTNTIPRSTMDGSSASKASSDPKRVFVSSSSVYNKILTQNQMIPIVNGRKLSSSTASDEASNAIGSINSINSIGASNSINSIGASNTINSIGASNSINSIGTNNSINSIGTSNSINSIGAGNAINSIGTSNSEYTPLGKSPVCQPHVQIVQPGTNMTNFKEVSFKPIAVAQTTDGRTNAKSVSPKVVDNLFTRQLRSQNDDVNESLSNSSRTPTYCTCPSTSHGTTSDTNDANATTNADESFTNFCPACSKLKLTRPSSINIERELSAFQTAGVTCAVNSRPASVNNDRVIANVSSSRPSSVSSETSLPRSRPSSSSSDLNSSSSTLVGSRPPSTTSDRELNYVTIEHDEAASVVTPVNASVFVDKPKTSYSAIDFAATDVLKQCPKANE